MLSSVATTRRLLKEIHRLKTEPPEGIRISTDEDNLLNVTGIIAGPAGTPYEGGYFRVSFNFTDEFPAAPPKCRMLTKIFHPNVSSSGEICVNTLKKDWKSTYGIEHILVTVKCLLIYPNPESALDEEAGRDLLENYDGYFSRAKLITKVHATPKTQPPEFDIPSKQSSIEEKTSSSATTPTPTTPTPTTPTPTTSTPSLTVSSTESISGTENDPAQTGSIVASAKPRSKGPTAAVVPVTPPPLQPAAAANTNLQSTPAQTAATTLATIEKSKLETKDSNLPLTSLRALPTKRAATAAAVGADKRKKALKRL